MKIKIYQLGGKKDKRDLLFMNYAFTEKHGGVDPTEYELVFEGEVKARDLEEVFYIFNSRTEMPANFRGHSLSVSDVVVNESGAYFCDSFGFVELLVDFTNGEGV